MLSVLVNLVIALIQRGDLSLFYLNFVSRYLKANLLALLYVMFSYGFVTFPMWCPGSAVILYRIDS